MFNEHVMTCDDDRKEKENHNIFTMYFQRNLFEKTDDWILKCSSTQCSHNAYVNLRSLQIATLQKTIAVLL